MEYVTCFCASSNRVDKYYLDSAYELGEILARNHKTVFYGGGKVGLMGRLAQGVLDNKGQIIGVIPKFMQKYELGHNGITRLIEVETMHQREEIMISRADCIVALPGGCGTFEELLQAITWKRLKIISAPIIIVNLKKYYNPLIQQLNKAVDENFMRTEHRQLWEVAESIPEVYDLIRAYDSNSRQIRIIDVQPNVT
ncbi:TIGR00730 family Rossman fold protein [Bacteroidetes/Chlorobi group bacterium MS-B_bin-24]|nr:MAG: TIGR00730 family Rossman fold protein [Bacteroidetes/Chlorobi group bacterium MS-B_bin-24]